MPFKVYDVQTIYTFKTNANQVLGDVAARADAAALAIDRVTLAMAEVDKGASAFIRSMGRASASLSNFGNAADRAGIKVDGAMSDIEMGVSTAATRVDVATASMAAGFERVALAARGANIAASGVGNRLGARPNGVAATESGHGVSGGMVGGIASLVTLADGIKTAANFQEAASQTGVAMGLPTSDVERMFRPVAMQMSKVTAQSMTDTMGMIQGITTSGFNDPKDLLANNAALPMAIARFADTQYLGKHHVGFQESVTQAAQLAHQLGTRDPASLEPMLNTLFKISQDMPDSLKTAATQLKFYAPQFVNAGVAPSEILQLQATADRLGLGGGRSGTGFRALLASLQSPSSSAMITAQSKLGLLDSKGRSAYINQKTGAFDVEGFFSHLNQMYDKARRDGTVGDFQRYLNHVSTSGAGSVLNLFSSDAGREQRAKVSATMLRVEDMDKAQIQLIDNLNGATKQLTTNFSNFAGVLAGPLIQPFTHGIKALADAFGNAAEFLQNHPTLGKLGTAALVGGSAVGVYKIAKVIGASHAILHAGVHHLQHRLGISGGAAIYGGRGAARGAEMVGERAGGPIAKFASALWRTVSLSELRGAGGKVAGRAFGAIGSFGRVNLPGLATVFDKLASVFRVTGIGADLLGKILGFGLGKAISFIGLRAIPVVGEVLLLIDAIKFLGAHSKDIGAMIGHAAHWIVRNGIPLVVGAFKDLIMGIVNMVVDTFKGHGFFDFVKNIVGGTIDSFKADDKADAAAASHKAANTGSHGRQNAYAAKNGGHTTHDHSTTINGNVMVQANNPQELGAAIKRAAGSNSPPKQSPLHPGQTTDGTQTSVLYHQQ